MMMRGQSVGGGSEDVDGSAALKIKDQIP